VAPVCDRRSGIASRRLASREAGLRHTNAALRLQHHRIGQSADALDLDGYAVAGVHEHRGVRAKPTPCGVPVRITVRAGAFCCR